LRQAFEAASVRFTKKEKRAGEPFATMWVAMTTGVDNDESLLRKAALNRRREKAMAEEANIAELRRQVSLIEQDVEGERGVSRHILRKVTEGETALLDLRADMAGLRKELAERVAAVENQLVTLRADLPRIIAEAVSAVVGEEFAKRK
jgi:hypothetical protein